MARLPPLSTIQRLSLGLACVAYVAGSPSPVAAQSVNAVLNVSPQMSSLSGEIRSAFPFGSSQLYSSGSIDVALGFASDSVHGLIVTSVEVLDGQIQVSDATIATTATSVTLAVSTSDLQLSASTPPVTATATGPGTSSAVISDGLFSFTTGSATLTGSFNSIPIDEGANFMLAPATVQSAATAATIVTTTQRPDGLADVALRVPVQVEFPIAYDPVLTWLAMSGELTATGTIDPFPPSVPAVPSWWGRPILVLVLIVGSVTALRSWTDRHA